MSIELNSKQIQDIDNINKHIRICETIISGAREQIDMKEKDILYERGQIFAYKVAKSTIKMVVQ